MYSVYDIVFEKSNFRSPFRKLISMLKIEKFDKKKAKNDVFIPIYFTSLCIRTAIRLIYLSHGNQIDAYQDLIENARMDGDMEQVKEFISIMEESDELAKIRSMFDMMCLYEREDKGYFDEDAAHFLFIDPEELKNRCLSYIDLIFERLKRFEKIYGMIPLKQCQFEGAYNSIITKSYCGIPTYLINDSIWVFCDSHGDKWGMTLLLISYVLGIHSTNLDYQSVTALKIVNLYSAQVKSIQIAEISDRTFYSISRNYIGYKVSEKAKDWRKASGTDQDRLYSVQQYFRGLLQQEEEQDIVNYYEFEPGKYVISYHEYWNFYQKYVNSQGCMPTKPLYIKEIFLIKSKDYLLFLAQGKEGLYLLNGGKFVKKTQFHIDYFERNVQTYGSIITKKFEKFWKKTEQVSDFLKDLNVDFCSGYIHGCIVDIDYFNHIYINPFDGKLTPYYAESKLLKIVYKDLYSLIKERIPDFLSDYMILCKQREEEQRFYIKIEEQDEIGNGVQTEYEPQMYSVSSYVKQFQSIHDANFISFWDENLLNQKLLQ